LSQPEAVLELTALPPLPRDEGGPVFAEPWHAQVFALAVTLSSQGHFTWKEWADELAGTLRAAAARGEPDDGSRYYDHWLTTLERLVAAKGLADQATLMARKDAWVAAYRNTPHGKPIELPQAFPKPDVRWILPGLVAGVATFWIGRHAVLSFREWSAIPQIAPFASAALDRCSAYGTHWSRIISPRCRH